MPVSTIARPTDNAGYSETLPCTAESADAARHLVRTALAGWHLERLTDDAVLIVSELVANSVRHTSSRIIRAVVTRRDDSVLLAVVDTCKDRVLRRNARPDDVAGRGLMLVDVLSDRWGTDVLPFGKRVWCELHTQSRVTACSRQEG
jgi:anti-sigma regulatory factor (Ser/Thr protein kinase)